MTKWVVFGALLFWALGVRAGESPSLALWGKAKYPAGFAAFAYVNPDAPKGGVLRQAALAPFDTFNPFVLVGMPPAGIGLTYDTLMKISADENDAAYGLIARSAELSPGKDRIAFRLNPAARFSDGSPITAADVVFSFRMLKTHGLPFYRSAFAPVAASIDAQGRVVFAWNAAQGNRELPLLLAGLPVLSEKSWAGRAFDRTTLDAPVSSGPYVIAAFDPGRFIEYRRNPDYWARDLNVNRGYHNFDIVRYDVYRDSTIALEAFKAGLLDVRLENEAKKWAAFGATDLARSGRVKRMSFPHRLPSGMQGFVFNLRRPVFADIRVREALASALDFEWMNASLFSGAYTRTRSFFDNTDLKAPPLPSEAERTLLAPYRAQLPGRLWTEPHRLPDDRDSRRARLEQALVLLGEAGWHVRDGVLQNARGERFAFEILLDAASSNAWERVSLAFAHRLKRLGIAARIRVVDAIQYQNRLQNFDYDMIVAAWGQTPTPGTEQAYFWGSAAARTKGSLNYSGLESAAVDGLIRHVVRARTAADLKTAAHALDRALLGHFIVIPHWYLPEHRYLVWDKFGMPDVVPPKGTDVMTWWAAPEK